MPPSEHRPDAAEPAAARESTQSDRDDSATPSSREEALLGLRGVVGNRAVADLVALHASGRDAGAEIDTFMLAGGAVRPALQRASAALRRSAPGLFGTVQRASKPVPVAGLAAAHQRPRPGLGDHR